MNEDNYQRSMNESSKNHHVKKRHEKELDEKMKAIIQIAVVSLIVVIGLSTGIKKGSEALKNYQTTKKIEALNNTEIASIINQNTYNTGLNQSGEHTFGYNPIGIAKDIEKEIKNGKDADVLMTSLHDHLEQTIPSADLEEKNERNIYNNIDDQYDLGAKTTAELAEKKGYKSIKEYERQVLKEQLEEYQKAQEGENNEKSNLVHH